jgi:hypothetical protein
MSGSCILIVEEDLLLRTRSRDVIIGCPKADGGSVRGIHRRPPLPVHEMATAQVRPSGLGDRHLDSDDPTICFLTQVNVAQFLKTRVKPLV